MNAGYVMFVLLETFEFPTYSNPFPELPTSQEIARLKKIQQPGC